ncbi:hypothetical protein KAFR_0D03090 [Kazachstania africana CBS 2517]|uniref:CS domain-containing protein n=1 Tax=Kazachstania africana (strain ATCC 22294 / BCRC 22015 / CBS 2517 / CECT 1963 / NBRC 1671 / NRRL Y-8276) TaxID=1071382 RepID=H2AUA7_KAZAF|nr:hypothetical protein KAFR_0D03090 [Kazachstania africana CBS 2517]CCF57957.1 hypothetical protein KAFR_0D03090 [Kazachstania africana CBS 2517]
MSSNNTLIPEVLWAQRSSDNDKDKNYLLLTISIPDCDKPSLKIDANSMELDAKSLPHRGDEESHHYNLKIDFFKEILPDLTLHKKANGQHYFLKIFKKDLQTEYWPRLTKEKIKYPYIKTDFDKWVDEDEQEEIPQTNDQDLNSLDFSQLMQGAGGAGNLQEMLGASANMTAREVESDEEDDDVENEEEEDEKKD